jgi:hypothetical protein
MWHPGYLIRVGLETGWVPFYSYEVTNNGFKGTASVRAIPVLFVFSMPIGRRFHFFSGTGSYLMQTELNYRGNVISSDHSLGYMLAAAYVQPITRRLGIAVEGKWMDAVGTRDAMLSAQVQLRWGMSMRKQPPGSQRGVK